MVVELPVLSELIAQVLQDLQIPEEVAEVHQLLVEEIRLVEMVDLEL